MSLALSRVNTLTRQAQAIDSKRRAARSFRNDPSNRQLRDAVMRQGFNPRDLESLDVTALDVEYATTIRARDEAQTEADAAQFRALQAAQAAARGWKPAPISTPTPPALPASAETPQDVSHARTDPAPERPTDDRGTGTPGRREVDAPVSGRGEIQSGPREGQTGARGNGATARRK